MAQTLTPIQRQILVALKGNFNIGSAAVLRSFRSGKGRVTARLVRDVTTRDISPQTMNALIAAGYITGYGEKAISDHVITGKGRDALEW